MKNYFLKDCKRRHKRFQVAYYHISHIKDLIKGDFPKYFSFFEYLFVTLLLLVETK